MTVATILAVMMHSVKLATEVVALLPATTSPAESDKLYMVHVGLQAAMSIIIKPVQG